MIEHAAGTTDARCAPSARSCDDEFGFISSAAKRSCASRRPRETRALQDVMRLAMQKRDDIGVGFKIAGLAQVGEIGPLVVARFKRALSCASSTTQSPVLRAASAGGDFADLVMTWPCSDRSHG